MENGGRRTENGISFFRLPPSDGGGVMRFYYQTDQGLRREENQDSVFVSEKECLAIVADGMGGAASGKKASEQAILSISSELSATKSISQTALKDTILVANSKIYNMACRHPDDFGMGTTVVVCLIRDGIAYYANVGDSPLYLIRKGSPLCFAFHNLIR